MRTIHSEDIPAGTWRTVNDGVMGGISSGGMTATADGTFLFAGELSLANNGGFASVRTSLNDGDLSRHAGISLRVRGDGRHYQLRLRTDDGFDGLAYRAHFGTIAGQWVTVQLHFTAFEPSYRGRVVAGVPALDPARIRQLSLMIADKRPGPFSLEVGAIRTWDGTGARSE